MCWCGRREAKKRADKRRHTKREFSSFPLKLPTMGRRSSLRLSRRRPTAPPPDLMFELSHDTPTLLRRRPRRSVAPLATLTAVAAAPRGWWLHSKPPPPLQELPVGVGDGECGGKRVDEGRKRARVTDKCVENQTGRTPTSQTTHHSPGATRRRYVWDGSRVRPVSPASAASGGEAVGAAAAELAADARAAAWRAFFPRAQDVTPDYWSYCRWRAGHRLCSSMLTNFATQALLQAVGVGARRSLPAAAGINWLLKDGLGRLGRLSAATRFGDSFDSDLKRFRFATSLLFTASVGLELATPKFPGQFLALAAAANVGKSVGLTTYISTQPSFGASFATRGNLADITAKAQAQQMVVDTVGLALCVATLRRGAAKAAAVAAVTGAPPGPPRVPLALLGVLAVGDLVAIWGELKAVHLRTLNRVRCELAADAWLASLTPTARQVPSPAQTASLEPLLSGVAAARRSGVALRLAPLEDAVAAPAQLTRALARSRAFGGGRDRYLVTVLPPPWASAAIPPPVAALLGAMLPGVAAGRLRVALRSDARPSDVVAAILAAAASRRELETLPRRERGSGVAAEAALDRGVAVGRKYGRTFGSALAAQGWTADPFLLAPRERAAWVALG